MNLDPLTEPAVLPPSKTRMEKDLAKEKAYHAQLVHDMKFVREESEARVAAALAASEAPAAVAPPKVCVRAHPGQTALSENAD